MKVLCGVAIGRIITASDVCTCGRDADEPRHRCSSGIPLNPARWVPRHEYLLDNYKACARSIPSRVAGDPFTFPKDAEVSKSTLEFEIGPESNVTAGTAQIAGYWLCSRHARRSCLFHIRNNKLDGVYSANIREANRHMFNDRGD